MNELAVKIAELLDISVEGAINLYPALRSQYMWYRFSRIFGAVGMMLLFISLLGVFIAITIAASDVDFDGKPSKWATKVGKYSLFILVIGILLFVASFIINTVFATDLMLLLEAL